MLTGVNDDFIFAPALALQPDHSLLIHLGAFSDLGFILSTVKRLHIKLRGKKRTR